MSIIRRAAGAATLACAVAAPFTLTIPAEARAAAQDYRFEVAGPPTKSGAETIVKLRLIHLPDGRAISDAIIFRTRFDMGPEGMASMTTPAKLRRANAADLYEVDVEPPIGGNWALTLSAKVQGETETVRGTVPITIPK